MAVPGSGLGSATGYGEETAWGTAVPVTRWIPHNSNTLAVQYKPVQGMGLQYGAYVNLGATRANVSSMITGDIEHDFTSKSMGLLTKHALGSNTSAVVGATVAYTQTGVIGSDTLGKGLTVQVAKPQSNGTVVPHTYAGCKITSWELSCAQNDILKAKYTFVGKSMTTGTALVTPSYAASANVFFFSQGTFNIGGTPYFGLRDFTLTGDNGLSSDDRQAFGNAGLINEPIRKDFAKYNIKGTAEYLSTDIEDDYIADAELSVSLVFVGASIVSSPPTFETLEIDLTGIRLNPGGDPGISGPDILTSGLDADILIPKAGGVPISVKYTTLDAAI